MKVQTMASTAQNLPPKMAAKFAEDAKNGKADRQIGEGAAACYEFYQGGNVVCLVSVDPPIGHIRRRLRGEGERK